MILAIIFGSLIAVTIAIKLFVIFLVVAIPSLIYMHRNHPLILSTPVSLFLVGLFLACLTFFINPVTFEGSFPLNPMHVPQELKHQYAAVIFSPVALYLNLKIAFGAYSKKRARVRSRRAITN